MNEQAQGFPACSMPIRSYAEPVVVLSDVHLSLWRSWKRRAEGLRGLWADAATVVFNGDTVEWSGQPGDMRYEAIRKHLISLCAADSAEAVFLAGNTDWPIGPSKHVFLAGGLILVTHGDVIFPEISPWQWHSHRLFLARQKALNGIPPGRRLTLEGQLDAVAHVHRRIKQRCENADKWTLAEWLRWRFPWYLALWQLGRSLGAWRAAPVLAARFVDKYAPQARCILLGHTHRPGLWREGHRTVVNTGSFQGPFHPWVARVEGSQVRIASVRHVRDRYVVEKEVAYVSI